MRTMLDSLSQLTFQIETPVFYVSLLDLDQIMPIEVFFLSISFVLSLFCVLCFAQSFPFVFSFAIRLNQDNIIILCLLFFFLSFRTVLFIFSSVYILSSFFMFLCFLSCFVQILFFQFPVCSLILVAWVCFVCDPNLHILYYIKLDINKLLLVISFI